MRAHKLAVVEASLAPFKYAFFEALGYAFVRAAGIMCDPSDTLMTYAKYGLIGGTILAIPYLICLLAMVEKGEEDASKGTMREHMILMTAEIVYSAIAACVGSCALGRSHGCTFSAIAVGAIGSVVSFALLYFMLGAVFAVLWSVMRLKNWVISPTDL
ncbi:hypothetical protein AMATHDRAFT_5876 [Amanita thiersii Skay4041]|uniref:Uncharacterized protein n=1 Tax=Amanita thiersii Skay4041 TaxID=703135 RepID=A0A2A9NL38_9AGAR|nr:hypothetical protein AMATHDRAFT_5876 [Amanita thiersii Skay4041]